MVGDPGSSVPPRAEAEFLKAMDRQLVGWDEPASRLRQAIEFDHFRLYVQPIVALQPPGGVALAEALVRLREEETRMLPPGDFLPAFEHYGMMAELDRWVVRNVVRSLAQGGRLARLSVNVSAQALAEAGFAPFVAMQLRMAGLAPQALVFELDESSVLEQRAAAGRFAADLKRIGCQLLIDGFGRRSASFEPLTALLPDYVKVDGTIVRQILKPGKALAKLGAIARVGQVTGVGVIAECVEEPEILARLTELGVGFAQGFGVREPQPIEGFFGA